MRNTIAWPHRADRRPLTIAHRGASAHAAENTLAAFRTAAELGADMWEIDVHLTADGVPVVAHDGNLARMFGVDRDIAMTSFAEIGRLAPDLPSFGHVVELASELGQALYVEIKAEGAGVVVSQVMQDMGFWRAGLGSFRIDEVAAMVEAGVPYPLAVLVPLGADPFECASRSRADIIHLCWERGGVRPQDLVTPALVAEAQAREFGIVLWHEERRAVMADLLQMPVLGICTNNPEMMAGCDSVDMRGIQPVCHRGANRFAPENTLAAARLSFEQGAAYVELDVRESADDELVVIHDATLERTTNGSGRVLDLTLAELKTLDAGTWFSAHYQNERIPTLAEMITLAIRYQGKLYIENKSAEPAKILSLVKQMGFLEHCFFWSGDATLQAGMRKISPQARIKAGFGAVATAGDADPDLQPSIIEMSIDDYLRHAPECLSRGLSPMLQYFGDDPAVFDHIVEIAPPLINLDRTDLLLAALRRAESLPA